MVVVVTDNDIKSFIITATTFDFGKIQAGEFDKFMYQGFDPWTILEELTKTKSSKGYSDEEMGRDMAMIIGISIIVGAPVEKKLEGKMAEEGQKVVKDLVVKWDVHWGGGKGKGPRHVNFPRVSLALPIVTQKIIKIIGPKKFMNDMTSSSLPDCFQHSSFPSVIPMSIDKDIKRMLLNACLCYGIDMTISLQALTDPDPKKISMKQKDYIRSSNTSKIPEEADRLSFFKTLNLAVEYDKIRKVLDVFKKLVDESYELPDETTFIKALKG